MPDARKKLSNYQVACRRSFFDKTNLKPTDLKRVGNYLPFTIYHLPILIYTRRSLLEDSRLNDLLVQSKRLKITKIFTKI